jgi:hypothetical protein
VSAGAGASWSADELSRVGGADELELSTRRPDGSLRPFVTIWAVQVEDAVYVRSAYGADNPWFRRALVGGTGRVRAGGVERDVTFTRLATDAADHLAIDAAYHTKYDRYGPKIVGPIVGPHAADVTLRVTPQN